MKKTKRFLALLGTVLLIAMYGSTLFFALTDHSETMGLLKASLACTIIIPVLLYAYTLVYKNIKGSQEDEKDSSGGDISGHDDQT